MPISQIQNYLRIENIPISGTATDITGIPAWANLIKMTVELLSTNGTNSPMLRIGSGGIPDAAGYLGVRSSISAANTANSSAIAVDRFQLPTINAVADASTLSIELRRYTGDKWEFSCTGLADQASDLSVIGRGYKGLAGKLDIIRFLTSNGTDIFDSGVAHLEIT